MVERGTGRLNGTRPCLRRLFLLKPAFMSVQCAPYLGMNRSRVNCPRSRTRPSRSLQHVLDLAGHHSDVRHTVYLVQNPRPAIVVDQRGSLLIVDLKAVSDRLLIVVGAS